MERAPIENPDRKIESFESKKFRVGNQLQMELMRRLCKPEEGDECFNEWPNRYNNGEKFRKMFDKMAVENSDILDEWDTNPDKYVDLFLGEFIESPEERTKRFAA